MNKVPQVSIIVPVYNSGLYLNKCLESLAQQTYDAIEVIVVNNNSSDNSQSIIDSYVETFPEKFISIFEEKPGVSAARNAGIRKARGRYLSFVDSDDWVDVRLYEICIAKFEFDNTDLLAFGRFNVNAEGEIKKRLPNLKSNVVKLDSGMVPLFFTTTFVWDKIFRTDIVNNNNLTFSENVQYAEDLEFMVRYMLYSRTFSIIQKSFYYYQTDRPSSITNVTSPIILDIPVVLHRIIEHLTNESKFENYAKDLYRVAIGLYIRRLRNFSKTGNKTIQAKFVMDFTLLFKHYFKNYSVKKEERTKHEKLFQLFRFKVIALAYIFTPNFLKSIALKVKNLIGIKKKLKPLLYATLRTITPVRKNTALFVCYFGETMRAAPYHVLKTWLEEDPEKKFLIASNNLKRDQSLFRYFEKNRVTIISTRSIAYLYWLAAANFLVNNSRLPTYFSKRKKQILLNTWHGTPVKHMGFDISEGANDVWRNQTQFLMSDVLLFPNLYAKEKMMNAYNLNNSYSGHVIVTPYPQNKVFKSPNLTNKIREELELGDKKVIAYMPTWRGISTSGMNVSEQITYFSEVLKNVYTQLNSEEYVIYYNLHQLVSSKTNSFSAKYAKTFPKDIELYEFLSCVDILITDYSSVLFDFCYSGKEVILLIEDYHHYKTTRGLYIEFSEIPCQKAHSADELVNVIKNSTLKGSYLNTSFSQTFCQGNPLGSASKIIKLLEYCHSAQESNVGVAAQKHDDNIYNCYGNTFDNILFLPSMNEFISKQLGDAIKNLGTNNIIVVHANDFSDEYNKLLKDINVEVIVAPEKGIYNSVQWLGIWLWNKRLLPKSLAKNAINAEKSRVLPKVKGKNVINLSTYNEFQLLADLGSFD